MKFLSARGLVIGSCWAAVVACGSSESDRATAPSNDAGNASGAVAGSAGPEAGRGGTSSRPEAGGAGAPVDAGAGPFGGSTATGGAGGGAATGGTVSTTGGRSAAAAGASGAAAGAAETGGEAGTGGTCSAGRTTVLFVVDSSTSMKESLPPRTPKWEVTRSVLASALDALPDSLRVGLMFFPQVPEGRPPCFEGSLAVPPALLGAETRAAFLSALARTEPTGSTPTYDAYAYAEAAIAPYVEAGPTVLVLLTDGLPAYGLGCTGDGPPATVEWSSLVTMVDSAARAGSYTLAVAAADSPDTHEMLTGVAHAGAPPGLCERNFTSGCFYDLDVSLELGPWLAESLAALASRCVP